MDHEKLFNCVSIITTVSFFSLILEMDNQGVQISSHLPDSHEPAVQNEYKSPFYKLWQYMKKNKPSLHNDSVVHSSDKKYSYIQRVSASYQYYSDKLRQLENYTKKITSVIPQKWFSFKDKLFFRKHNSYNIFRSNTFGFVPQMYLFGWMRVYFKNTLKRIQIYSCKECSKFGNLASSIRNTMWLLLEKPNKINVCINRFFHHWVCCL
ncbi:hypothetical protein MEC_01224 [Bartonella alsatica IBS 382]|uniref:Uncharacterized protein n=1 Tax=Bartonella alsatica IBS 382 TaxID=1094551 RepID=J1IU69_9HYPH|nr:hypothetical protein MEC_01224 [Bartonella alsatica IBS 382]